MLIKYRDLLQLVIHKGFFRTWLLLFIYYCVLIICCVCPLGSIAPPSDKDFSLEESHPTRQPSSSTDGHDHPQLQKQVLTGFSQNSFLIALISVIGWQKNILANQSSQDNRCLQVVGNKRTLFPLQKLSKEICLFL